MAKKILLVSPVLVCAAVITGLVLSGVGGAGQEASPAELEQAKAEIRTLIKSREFALADAAVADLIDKFSTDPALPGALYETAREYRWVKKYGRAKSMYQDIMRDYPESVAVGRAQLGLARVDVLFLMQSGEVEAAQAAIDSQVQAFAGHPDLPETLYWLAKEHEWKLNLEQAKSTYQHMLNACPDSSCATKAELGLLRVTVADLVESGDLAAANPAFEKMVADFDGHEELGWTLYWMAKRYEGQDAFEEAKEIYWLIIERWPGSDEAKKSQVDIHMADVCSLIRSGKDSEGLYMLRALIINSEAKDYLCMLVPVVVREYYIGPGTELQETGDNTNANSIFKKAVLFLDTSLTILPKCDQTSTAYYLLAECYHNSGELEQAIYYYQKVADAYPNCDRVPITLFRISQCYEKLALSGSIPKKQAAEGISTACKRLISNYPADPLARLARKLLARWQIP